MEKHLRDIKAWCWRYKENTRNYPGLHFTATAEACDAILKGLKQLRRETPPAHRTILLKALRKLDEQKVSGGQAYESFPRLRVSLRDESAELLQMSFRVEDATACFDFTEKWLSEFEHGLANVKRGIGDYSIQPEAGDRKRLGQLDRKSECLWFWPCFGHLHVMD
jgi:hypothetical protein